MTHILTLSGECVKVLLHLRERAASTDVKIGVTPSSISRSCDIGRDTARRAVQTLVDEGFVTRTEKSKYSLLQVVDGTYASAAIPYSETDRDETRLERAEREIARLQALIHSKRYGVSSTLSVDLIDPQSRVLASVIERDFGRALTQTDAWYLGQLVAWFGAERVMAVYKRMATGPDPLKAVYASMKRKIVGNEYKPEVKEERPVVYRSLSQVPPD